MKICEDCQHKDVCKFKEEAESKCYDQIRLNEPLVAVITCRYKLFMGTCPSVWTYQYPDGTTTDWPSPNITDTE